MKTRVTDPKDLRVGDPVGPFVVERVNSDQELHVLFDGFGWQYNAVVAELLKMHEVWHDDPEPDVPGERIVARGRVVVGANGDPWIDGVTPYVFVKVTPYDFVKNRAKSGDEIIVVRGGAE